jgi:hypothetical protein
MHLPSGVVANNHEEPISLMDYVCFYKFAVYFTILLGETLHVKNMFLLCTSYKILYRHIFEFLYLYVHASKIQSRGFIYCLKWEFKAVLFGHKILKKREGGGGAPPPPPPAKPPASKL